MKRIKIIENPSSGRQGVDRRLDRLVRLLINDGWTVKKFKTEKKNDAMLETMRTCANDWDLILACGGDGTINEIATGIVKSEKKIPVAILATGTVNDFATHLEIPKTVDEFYEMIKEGNYIDVDLGQMGENYFVNVAAGGLLSNVGYQVLPERKLVLGRLAYYLEGLKEITWQGFDPIKIEVESEEYSGETDALLFLISNSQSIGGFKNIAPKADVSDGLFDVIIIKSSDIMNMANIFFSIFTGDHINHQDVIYFKTNKIGIKSIDEVPIDIDGEYGGKLPSEFEVVNNAFRVLIKE